MPGHFCSPVGQSGPGARFPDFLTGRKQSAGIGDRTAAHRATMEDGRMPEEPHVEEAAQTECGAPEPAMDGPTAVRQILGRPAPPHLHDGNTIALLHQPVGGHTAAEPGADYDEVEIESILRLVDVGGACGVGVALSIP